jgi:hypothetical protein
MQGEDAEDDSTATAEQRAAHPLARLSGQNYQTVIDRHIAAGQAAGMFDKLDGTGKPLQLDDDDKVPEELRVGFRMLKNAGFAPPWIELQQDIRAQQDVLEAWQTRQRQRWPQLTALERHDVYKEQAQKISELNKLITSYNLIVPAVVGQQPLYQLWRERQKLETS